MDSVFQLKGKAEWDEEREIEAIFKEEDEKNSSENSVKDASNQEESGTINCSSKFKDKLFKEKKDLLVGILNDDFSGIEIPKSTEEDKEVIEDNCSPDIAAFINIKNRLIEYSKKYNRKIEEVMSIFVQCSCRYDTLEDFLSSSKTTNKIWKSLEDLVLIKPYLNEEAYDLLLEEKGEEELKNRKRFLSLK